jgi:glucose-1-phosphate thymidylyltransferase long form
MAFILIKGLLKPKCPNKHHIIIFYRNFIYCDVDIIIPMIKAIIMAGGKGSRIRPLTLSRPKPLIPVANRPIIDYIIQKLKANNYTDLVFTLSYLKNHITKLLEKEHQDLNINYSIEKSPLGTAGGVKNAQKYLDDTFFVLSGDVLLDVDLDHLLKFHQEKNALATILLTPVKDPTHFGIAVLDNDNQVIKFLEKPSSDQVFSKIANTGTYILEPEIFDYIDEIPGNKKGEIDFSKDVFPKLIQEKASIYGYILDGYWNDVGRPESFLKANRDVLNKKIRPRPHGKIMKECVGKFGDIWAGKNVQIEEKVRIIGPVVIGDNAVIKKGCVLGKNTVIGEKVQVEEHTHIQGSVILPDSIIKAHSYLKDCIIDSKCILERGCVLEKGVILGSSVQMGPYSLVKSNRSITNKIEILRDSIIDSDYPIETE